MRVGVIGTGYVGLVTGACFADLGLQVTCVDKDEAKVAGILAGDLPIFEPGLDSLVQRNVAQGRLAFSTDLAATVAGSLVVVIAVGTPPRPDGTADLAAVEEVARTVGRQLDGYKLIVTKSTVPAGTGARIREWITAEAGPDADFEVASNPEFLREGSAIEDFMAPDRIVVGVEGPKARGILEELYRPLTQRKFRLLVTDVPTAEVIKYASNSFLAAKVSFINEVSALCEAVGADVEAVAEGMGSDDRIGPRFLQPGPGYGGSCFPKDTLAFAALAREKGAPLRIVEATIEANARQRARCGDKVFAHFGGDLAGRRVGALGLSFKPDTDDMRDAQSVEILRRVLDAGGLVRAFDPEAAENAREFLPEVEYVGGPLEAARDAELLVIFTHWNQFRALDWAELKAVMAAPDVLDLRNLYDPAQMAAAGIRYRCLGRPGRLLPSG